MRILVTGAAGYVGKNVLQQLSKTDHEVVALDRVPFTGPADVIIVSEIGKLKELSPKVDVVIHLASDISVPESVQDPNKYFRNNVNELQHLLKLCFWGGVKHFVFASSAATYGNATGVLTERKAGSPINPYGWTKWIGEQMIDCQHFMSTASLRFFNIAGWDKETDTGECRQNPYHLITMAAKAATGERDSLKVFGTDYDTPDGTCVRDYVHVVDVADAIIKSAEYGYRTGTSFTANVSYARGASVREVANIMRGLNDFEVIDCPRREGDPATLVGSCGIISSSSIGWQPQYLDDLHGICESAYLWELELKKRRG